MVICGLKVFPRIQNLAMSVISYCYLDKIVHFKKRLDVQKFVNVIIAAPLFMNLVSRIQSSTVNSLHRPSSR